MNTNRCHLVDVATLSPCFLSFVGATLRYWASHVQRALSGRLISTVLSLSASAGWGWAYLCVNGVNIATLF